MVQELYFQNSRKEGMFFLSSPYWWIILFFKKLQHTSLNLRSLNGCNWTRTHNHLNTKRLSVRLRTKWFWVRVQLQSLKLQISRVSSKEFLDIQVTIECWFTLKRVRDMTRTYSLGSLTLRSSRCIGTFLTFLTHNPGKDIDKNAFLPLLLLLLLIID